MIQSAVDREKTREIIPLKPDVLILGGGISGVTIAEILARGGVGVTLIEKTRNTGGKAAESRAFNNRPEAGEKEIRERFARAGKLPGIAIITGAELTGLEGHFGSFQARIKKEDGESLLLQPSVVVAATGYSTGRNIKGISVADRIIFMPDMEKLIAEAAERLLWDGKVVGAVIFLLDQSNEDMKLASIATLRQSLIIHQKFNCRVSILCRDLKVSFEGGERLYRKARENGVLFFKYDEPPELSPESEGVRVSLPDNTILKKEEREEISLLADLLVLPEVNLPNGETEKLCRMLRVPMGKGGYMMNDNPQFQRVRSNRRGIFIAGACRFPQELSETLREAEAAAEEIMALLAPGVYECGPLVAEVDASKCALCYTCPRLCPHSAITIERHAERNVYRTFTGGTDGQYSAARVEPAACYGCGICVAECPARAISLLGESVSSAYIAAR